MTCLARSVLFAVLALALAACGGDPAVRTKDISGLMPELEFTLVDERGETVTAADYAGTVNLLFFGFTHCPDICPVTLGKLDRAVDELPAGDREDVRILFVSVDPQRDDPAALREYTDFFGEGIVGLTGEADALDALTKRYRTTYGYGEETAPGEYAVSHSSAVFAFDRDGEARLLMRQDDPIEAITADVARLLGS
jgi:protein SCO1/2